MRHSLLEIHRDVKEVVARRKAVRIQHLSNVVALDCFGKTPQHEGAETFDMLMVHVFGNRAARCRRWLALEQLVVQMGAAPWRRVQDTSHRHHVVQQYMTT